MLRIFRNSEDEMIITGLKQGGRARRLNEFRLYNRFRHLVVIALRKHRLTEEESRTAYADAVLAVIDNICRDKYKGEANLQTYISKIFYYKCVDLVQKRQTITVEGGEIEDMIDPLADPVAEIIKKQVNDRNELLFRRAFESLGANCKHILQLKLVHEYADADIATALNFQSAAVAKTTRLRCITKLKELFEALKNG